MGEEIRDGFYKDRYGRWQVDRRTNPDRRARNAASYGHDRRRMYRRKADRELLEKDHLAMIDEALTDFAAEHNGHL